MSDRSEVIEMFEQSIVLPYALPEDLVDQFLYTGTIEYSFYATDEDNPLTYTKNATIINGSFSRVLLGLEKRILSLYMKIGLLKRTQNAKTKEIGYATKNIATKDVGSMKRALAEEIVSIQDDIEKFIAMLITPGVYNV